jgi:hypothetical protein
MIFLLTLLLSLGPLSTSESDSAPSYLNLAPLPETPGATLDEKISSSLRLISNKATYFIAGTALGSLSLFARLGWRICQVSPWSATVGNECLLLSYLCARAATHVFSHLFSAPPSFSPLFQTLPLSHFSWYLNRLLLSQIPATSEEEKQLLLFLEKRWLAKSAGFYSTMLNWVCPCFGISVQAHPETDHTYARDPMMQSSSTYNTLVKTWQNSLIHPLHFPLILTRPYELQDYLPGYLSVSKEEEIETTMQRLALKMHAVSSKVVIDLAALFADTDLTDREKWLEIWKRYEEQFTQACKKHEIALKRLVCIQTLRSEEIGGIRLLPFASASAEEIDRDREFLLEWVSTFGLSANRIELDRWHLPSAAASRAYPPVTLSLERKTREEYLHSLTAFEQNWKLSDGQKDLLLKGTLQVIKRLLTATSDEKWEAIDGCRAKACVVHLSFAKIREQLELLARKEKKALFFDTASHFEEIHANLCALLEVLAPFADSDFPAIYKNLLTTIPEKLKPLISCGIHSSGMTSLAGIFKAAEKTLGHAPVVLCGENTYFENVIAAKRISKALSMEEASEEDWKEADLILGQFNPVLKRIELKKVDSSVTEYRVEKIAESLHRCLKTGREKPLTVAIDCTLDFIDSRRVGALVSEFQNEIEQGLLNIICYRSGLKFDLFGMDNYCGAPFYSIHSRNSKWAFFDLLFSDPVLQTDPLSCNWFCLAYQSAASELEIYRKQVFENTRALLDKIPARLFQKKHTGYRVIPFDRESDPAFIDVKIVGAFHQLRGAALVAGILSLKCMEERHPIFYRQSLGFYHPNFSLIFDDDCTTIRLTLGLDPAQIALMAKCFEMIDALEDPAWEFQGKLHHEVPFFFKNEELIMGFSCI